MQRNGQRWFALLVIGLVLAFSGGCGGDDDDDGGGGKAGGSAGRSGTGVPVSDEECASPGYTQTGCICDSGAVGRRTCTKSGFWEECACPPVEQQCVEGEKIKCNPCQGESEGKMTVCLKGGTFDCGCD